jgi:hypothetical protein
MGLNIRQALTQSGIAVKDGIRSMIVPLSTIHLERQPDHPAYSISIHLPVDPDVVATMFAEGIPDMDAIDVYRDGNNPDGSPRLVVLDGRQRFNALTAANAKRAVNGFAPHPMPVRLFTVASALEIKAHILKANRRALNNSPVVLAYDIAEGLVAGLTEQKICELRGLKKHEFRRMRILSRLPAGEAAKFDRGEIPLSALDALENVPTGKLPEAIARATEAAQARAATGKTGKVKSSDVRTGAKAAETGKAVTTPGGNMVPRKSLEAAEAALTDAEGIPFSDVIRATLRAVLGDPEALAALAPDAAKLLMPRHKRRPAADETDETEAEAV